MLRRRRLFQLLLLFALLPAGWRLAVLCGPGGEVLRKESERLSSRDGELAAIRGRIYDGEGTLLVWSERHYDLYWNGTVLPEALQLQLQRLLPGWQEALPADPDAGALLLRRDLTMAEAEAVDPLSVRYPALDTVLRWERRTIADAALQNLIGEVMTVDGCERGLSGWEEEFDDQLRGRNGRYTVLVDRNGRWIDRTFRQLEPPEPGEDVHLAATLATLREPAPGAAAVEPAEREAAP